MVNNSPQDLIHCDKCHKLIEPHNQSPIKPLCNKCEKNWHIFFTAYMLLIEEEFRVSREGSPNPTWYVFLNKLPSKYSPKNKTVKFIFR